jgi:UDP-glucose 4-epimerase
MKTLITGGAGFVGSHIVSALMAAGHAVSVLDDLSSGSRDNLPADVPLHQIDIRDSSALAAVFAAERPDAVCHQAAQMSVSRSVREPRFDAEVNCIGLINVLDAAVASGCKRVVFASSGGVLYGDVTEPVLETAPANPISPYAITKWVGEQYLAFYAREHGLATVALRYSNVYGPRQNPHGEAGVVAIFCKKLLTGEPARINGDGRYVRDYVYGPDVAAANLAALNFSDTGATAGQLISLNIGTGVGTDVNQLETLLRQKIEGLLAVVGRPAVLPQPQYGPARAGDLRSNLVAIDRAAELLAWRPTTGLEAGLEATARWFLEHAPG